MRRCIFLVMTAMMPMVARADVSVLDAAISDARIYCLGISDELNHLKTMAGINTAVTAVGTAAGAGATAVGIAKVGVDKELSAYEETIAALEEEGAQRIETDEDFAEIFGGFLIESGDPEFAQIGKLIQEQQRLEAKSKKLGNWRTGLLAANTVTNVAGTVIAANNKVSGDLKDQIQQCIMAVDVLSRARMQARIASDANDTEMVEYASRIVDACAQWGDVNLSSINAKAKGATISSGIGAGVGFVGTITSAIANTDKTRNDNTESGKQKEKNLNTTANVMAGGATVASGVATVFNATQIGAIKKAAAVADACEGVLK